MFGGDAELSAASLRGPRLRLRQRSVNRGTAATRGLHAAGIREVAAEAGVSLRLVQYYYFGTKEELLLAAGQPVLCSGASKVSPVARYPEPVTGGYAP
jgi:DNA-binding transcriptional regulator YbjK